MSIDYIVERIGIDPVALGSDFDGTVISDDMKDAADLRPR
ncbi:dipeptidase [Shinella sp. YE25]|nr:dipeptidase [Shinella sp. YE25]